MSAEILHIRSFTVHVGAQRTGVVASTLAEVSLDWPLRPGESRSSRIDLTTLELRATSGEERGSAVFFAGRVRPDDLEFSVAVETIGVDSVTSSVRCRRP